MSWAIYYCLWIPLESMKICSDFFINEYSVFNIWVLLSVLWLFFAWYQLIKPRHTLRIRVKSNFLGNNYLWIWFALMFSIISVILPFIPWKPIILLWYRIFREILSLIVILIHGIYLFFIATTPIKKIWDIDKFTNIIISYIWKWWEYTDALWLELWSFFEKIVKFVDKWNKTAMSLMRIMTDKSLIDNIVTKQLYTISIILEVYLERKSVWDRHIDMFQEEFISIIIQESLAKKDSIISKEINGELFWWINRWAGLLSQNLFKKFSFIATYSLFSKKRFAWSYRAETEYNQNDYRKNYISFLQKWIDSFFENIPENLKYYKTLYDGLLWLCWYNWIIKETENYPSLSIQHKLFDNWEAILKHFNNKIPDFSIDKIALIESIDPKNIFDSLSLWFYKICENISHIQETKENSFLIRSQIMSVATDILWSSNDSAISKAIRERVRMLFEKQILNNNIFWYYPMIIRIFFHLFWFQIFEETIEDEDKTFCIRIILWLKKQLPALFEWKIWWYDSVCTDMTQDIQQNRLEKAHKIIGDMLPKNMYYDHSRGILWYFFWSDMSKWELNIEKIQDDKIEITRFS